MTNERRHLLKAVRLAGAVLALLLVGALAPAPAAAQVRIKDIASFEGVRDNLLVGYGLVVGLNGTGDKRLTLFTAQSLTNILQQMGVSVPPRLATPVPATLFAVLVLPPSVPKSVTVNVGSPLT